MQAGKLDRVVQIQRPTTALDLYGVPITAWALVATMRAQKLENAINNREGQRGDTTDNLITFRMRWISGIGLENRVLYEDQQFTIISIKELGRHLGLDLACERVGP